MQHSPRSLPNQHPHQPPAPGKGSRRRLAPRSCLELGQWASSAARELNTSSALARPSNLPASRRLHKPAPSRNGKTGAAAAPGPPLEAQLAAEALHHLCGSAAKFHSEGRVKCAHCVLSPVPPTFALRTQMTRRGQQTALQGKAPQGASLSPARSLSALLHVCARATDRATCSSGGKKPRG